MHVIAVSTVGWAGIIVAAINLGAVIIGLIRSHGKNV